MASHHRQTMEDTSIYIKRSYIMEFCACQRAYYLQQMDMSEAARASTASWFFGAYEHLHYVRTSLRHAHNKSDIGYVFAWWYDRNVSD
jgi:hypothetical protein